MFINFNFIIVLAIYIINQTSLAFYQIPGIPVELLNIISQQSEQNETVQHVTPSIKIPQDSSENLADYLDKIMKENTNQTKPSIDEEFKGFTAIFNKPKSTQTTFNPHPSTKDEIEFLLFEYNDSTTRKKVYDTFETEQKKEESTRRSEVNIELENLISGNQAYIELLEPTSETSATTLTETHITENDYETVNTIPVSYFSVPITLKTSPAVSKHYYPYPIHRFQTERKKQISVTNNSNSADIFNNLPKDKPQTKINISLSKISDILPNALFKEDLKLIDENLDPTLEYFRKIPASPDDNMPKNKQKVKNNISISKRSDPLPYAIHQADSKAADENSDPLLEYFWKNPSGSDDIHAEHHELFTTYIQNLMSTTEKHIYPDIFDKTTLLNKPNTIDTISKTSDTGNIFHNILQAENENKINETIAKSKISDRLLNKTNPVQEDFTFLENNPVKLLEYFRKIPAGPDNLLDENHESFTNYIENIILTTERSIYPEMPNVSLKPDTFTSQSDNRGVTNTISPTTDTEDMFYNILQSRNENINDNILRSKNADFVPYKISAVQDDNISKSLKDYHGKSIEYYRKIPTGHDDLFAQHHESFTNYIQNLMLTTEKSLYSKKSDITTITDNLVSQYDDPDAILQYFDAFNHVNKINDHASYSKDDSKTLKIITTIMPVFTFKSMDASNKKKELANVNVTITESTNDKTKNETSDSYNKLLKEHPNISFKRNYDINNNFDTMVENLDTLAKQFENPSERLDFSYETADAKSKTKRDNEIPEYFNFLSENSNEFDTKTTNKYSNIMFENNNIIYENPRTIPTKLPFTTLENAKSNENDEFSTDTTSVKCIEKENDEVFEVNAEYIDKLYEPVYEHKPLNDKSNIVYEVKKIEKTEDDTTYNIFDTTVNSPLERFETVNDNYGKQSRELISKPFGTEKDCEVTETANYDNEWSNDIIENFNSIETELHRGKQLLKDTSKANVTTKVTVLPKNNVTTKATVPPKNNVTTKATVLPKNNVTTKATVPPKNNVTTKATVPPKNYVTTKATVPPKNNVTTKATVPSKVNVTTTVTKKNKMLKAKFLKVELFNKNIKLSLVGNENGTALAKPRDIIISKDFIIAKQPVAMPKMLKIEKFVSDLNSKPQGNFIAAEIRKNMKVAPSLPVRLTKDIISNDGYMAAEKFLKIARDHVLSNPFIATLDKKMRLRNAYL